MGCAFGGFLIEAQKNGYEVHGLELSKYAAKEARKRGLDVKEGELSKYPLAKNSIDVLSMIEVFEHIPDPLEAMENLGLAMKKKSLVVVQTANFLGRQAQREGPNYHYYLPGHYYYYSTYNLQLLFQKFGFNKFHFYRGVDFSLFVKIKKMLHSFRNSKEYWNLLPAIYYHLKSRVAYGHFAMTSSMVMYAERG